MELMGIKRFLLSKFLNLFVESEKIKIKAKSISQNDQIFMPV